MGALLHPKNGRALDLESDGVVGRGSGCWPRFDEDYISSQHARIRWQVDGWQIKDLGSRNGTFINGERLTSAVWCSLAADDEIAFGKKEFACRLVDESRPVPLLFSVDGSGPVRIDAGVGAVPPEAADATLLCDSNGGWWLEPAEGRPVKVRHREIFEVSGKSWYLSFQAAAPTTRIVTPALRMQEACLVLSHSLNEEHVQLALDTKTGCIDLGDRQHNYLVLVLARARLADQARSMPETACGWVAAEVLASQLKVSREHLNLQIFRIRKQFGAVGFEAPGAVIERRASTYELRLGFRDLRISQD